MKIDPRNIYKLNGVAQHYAWGGFEFIPALLGVENTGRQPFAEYWMGAHASAPSMLNNAQQTFKLNEVFAAQPHLLGDHVRHAFHHLPYLFKVLDVREMLSIQVHPDKEEALKGFDNEESMGIELNAPNRNYKDRNHKPEVMVALGDFWLLHGFKQPGELKQTLTDVPQLRSLLPIFEETGYSGLYRHVMELPVAESDAMLQTLVQKEVRRRSFHESEKTEPGYWVGEYYLNRPAKHIDKGVFAIYFLNIVFLERNQGIFQGAGVPHAYLQGQNVELMANSDNVLRGGLTSKHVDTAELIR
ncbi:MAG: manA, partial [Chitinophagaceae bacterium]|nr:manA [Chitinophagaceae bacterium]